MTAAGAGVWPFAGDGPTARARKVAQAYRAKLAEVDPTAVEVLDQRMRVFGQLWAVPTLLTGAPGAALDPMQAAEYSGVEPATLRQWRRRGRLAGQRTERGWRYTVEQLDDAVANVRHRGSGHGGRAGGVDAAPCAGGVRPIGTVARDQTAGGS